MMLNMMMSSYQYRKSHCEDKMVVRSSYLHNEISYTGKMVAFIWMLWVPSINWVQFSFFLGGGGSFLVYIYIYMFPCTWAQLTSIHGSVYHRTWIQWDDKLSELAKLYCPACRTTLVATRFRVAVICPIIQVLHCIRVFFYFVWFVFINHIFQFYYELCTFCNILDIYLS